MDTSMAGGFNTTLGSPSASGKKKQNKRSQSIVPVVVSQITSSTYDEFTLFGRPVQIASLVGILRNYEIQSTKATCVLNDHTGEIKAVMWLEADGDSITSLPPVKEGNVVRIFGSIRIQDGARTIMILRMFPVDDCNIITTHLLRVIEGRLAAEKVADHKFVSNGPAAKNSLMASTFASTSESNDSGGLQPLQMEILKILHSVPASDKIGTNRRTILSKYPPHREAEVDEALKFLLNEGHAYTTIDPENFKSTDFL